MNEYRLSRRLFFFLSMLALISAALGAGQEFGYPVNGEPWYYIRAQFPPAAEMKGGTWKVARLEANGLRSRDFVLFQNGKELLENGIMGGQAFDIKFRAGWQGGKTCMVTLLMENTKTKKTHALKQTVTAPSAQGYWNPDWKNYLSLLVSEENGIERTRYPVHATVGILNHSIRSGDEIRVVKAEKKGADAVYTEVPCQVYDIARWEDRKLLSAEEKDAKTGERITRYHATASVSLAFPADLKPREKATYLVFYNNAAAARPAYPSDLKVTGAGIGKTIENAFYRATLNPKSGVLYEITEKSTRTKMEHKLETNGSIHWNPCVYSPPHAWYHTSDWENPPFTEVTGPLFYSIRIAAPIPYYKDVVSSVTYYFYANSPFILVETSIHILNDLFVQALRNGEIVFNKKVFDRAGYKTMEGRVTAIDLTRTRMHPDHVITLRPDTPWVTFYSEKKGVAFANLYLDVSMLNVGGGEASAQQPFLYIQHGPWYYLARGLVYSFGTNNQNRMLAVKKGSVYHEKIAWIPFAFPKGQDYAGIVDKHYDMLKYPLSVIENQETYLESPEGWVVPILTEPFEEGVKEAIGGKAKR